MENLTGTYPPDMEPLGSDNEFFDELAELVEEHEERHGRDREQALYDVKAFAEFWIVSRDMTGETW